MKFSDEMLEFMKFAVDHYDKPDLMIKRFSDFAVKCSKDDKKASLLDFMVFLAGKYNSLLRDLLNKSDAAMQMMAMMFDSWEANRHREKIVQRHEQGLPVNPKMMVVEVPMDLLKKIKHGVDKIKDDEQLFEQTVEILKEKTNLPDEMITKTAKQFFEEIRGKA